FCQVIECQIVGNTGTAAELYDNWLGHVISYSGCNPANSRPAISSKPQRMFMDWTAWPDAPLTRLSIAAVTTTRLSCASTSKPTSQKLVPDRIFGSGERWIPDASLTMRMNGSSR